MTCERSRTTSTTLSRRYYRSRLATIKHMAKNVIEWHDKHHNDDVVSLTTEIETLRWHVECMLKVADSGLHPPKPEQASKEKEIEDG